MTAPIVSPAPVCPRCGTFGLVAGPQPPGRDPRPGGSRPGRAEPGSVLLLTSGSTGAPKAVELTEDRLLHVARAVARHNRLTPADRGFSPLPLFHINAQVVALLASLNAGAALLVDRRFRRHGFWEMLADRDVTWINAVPAILTMLADYPSPSGRRACGSSGPRRRRCRSPSGTGSGPGPARRCWRATA